MSKVYARMPEGYVCTQEAARMLGGVRENAARRLLRLRKVPCVCYRLKGNATAKAWDEACVRQVAASKPAMVGALPRGCVSSETAREMMDCSRATLYRYVRAGILSEQRGRVQGKRGLRDASYFLREEVEQTAERCREMKLKQARQAAAKARREGKADFFGEVCRALAEELGLRCALRLAETREEEVDEYRFAEKGSFYLAFAIDKGGNVRWGKNYALSASRLLRVCDAALEIQRWAARETMTPEAFAAAELPEASWKLRDLVRILKEEKAVLCARVKRAEERKEGER